MSKKTLEDLAPGQSGTILSIANKSGSVKRRLVDMGLTPGTEVRVTKIAPLGDPIEVSLRGTSSLCARRTPARSSWASPGPGAWARPRAAPEDAWAAPTRAAAPPSEP